MTRVADFAKDHRVHLLQGAQELFPALIEAMDAALSDIQFETYIFDFTCAPAPVAEALIRAAQRGVRTHLVVDGVGTGPLPKAWQQRMKSAGVQVRVYSPLGPLGLLLPHRWRRLHRKLCVVDGLVVFCGGINVLDDLYDPNYGDLDAPRFDFAVQATGSLAAPRTPSPAPQNRRQLHPDRHRSGRQYRHAHSCCHKTPPTNRPRTSII